ncbi:MAG: hypothetical protein EZS28_045913, partial [Streblomastix strix]
MNREGTGALRDLTAMIQEKQIENSLLQNELQQQKVQTEEKDKLIKELNNKLIEQEKRKVI